MHIKLDTKDINQLQEIQRNTRNRVEYIKVTVILSILMGFDPQQIAKQLGVHISTVYNYGNRYLEKGLDFLETHYKVNSQKLSSDQLIVLKKELRSKLYISSAEIANWISEEFAIDYTSEGLVKLLHRLGFSYKKTKQVPCEADTEKQEEFVNEQLSPIIEEAKAGQAVVYFMDGVHPTHNTRSTYAWIEKGKEMNLKTVSGRDRVNINAALNALDVTDIQSIESSSVNAQSTQELYEKLLQKHPGQKVIYAISDNARYYRNKKLTQWLKDKRIVQVFLPPYSPNLNIIERLWKFMRKKVIDPIFYRTKTEFREAILAFFNHIKNFEENLKSLLTLRFPIRDSNSIYL